jgi:transposase, IS30 family
MRYQQITPEERHTIAALRRQQPMPSYAAIARVLCRPRCTILREVRRNRSHHDGGYRAVRAQEMTNARRSLSRRNNRLSPTDWDVIRELLWADLSPEQVSGKLRLDGRLSVSHETIYKHIWHDKRHGGQLYRRLRQRPKYRKRYGPYEKRGRLTGKRHISERPAAVELRRELGHWEIDTMSGKGSNHCILTLVERSTGCVLIAKLRDHTVAQMNRRAIQLIDGRPDLFKTITADNGTEFHGYEGIERATRVRFYFATPYHSWERGTNENTNGLIRQYLPKGRSLKNVTQARCNEIARILNNRPRKRFGFLSPLERLRQLEKRKRQTTP